MTHFGHLNGDRQNLSRITPCSFVQEVHTVTRIETPVCNLCMQFLWTANATKDQNSSIMCHKHCHKFRRSTAHRKRARSLAQHSSEI